MMEGGGNKIINRITFPTSFASMEWRSSQTLTPSCLKFSSTACGNTRFSSSSALSSNPMLWRPRMFSNFFSQLLGRADGFRRCVRRRAVITG